jgi:addiction module RelE/StbE family toxin
MFKEHSVTITKMAEMDIDEIVLYIAQDTVQNALKVMDRIKAKIFSLSTFPEKGHWVPELLAQNIKEYREIIEQPWRIIYKLQNEEVKILTVIDGRRNVQDILIQKLLK